MVRRTLGFIATVILMTTAGYQLAWHKDLRDKFFDHPWQSFGLLVLVLVAIAVFIHATFSPHHGSALIGAFLGGTAVVWGSHLFDGIKWTTLGFFTLAAVGVVVLGCITVLDRVPGLPQVTITRNNPVVTPTP